MNEGELAMTLSEGEGYYLEFKRSVDKSLIQEVTAFANASGGKVIIGVDDYNKVVGTDISNAAKSQIIDTLSKIDPRLEIQLEVIQNLLIVHVPEGADKPYCCPSGFYLRIGPNSQKMNRNDIMAFFQSEGKFRFDEMLCQAADVESNLNPESLDHFVTLSGLSRIHPDELILENLHCVEKYHHKQVFNNAGLLAFGQNPQFRFPHTVIVCALYKGKTKLDVLDRKDIAGNLFDQIEGAMVFLKKHLNLSYHIDKLVRVEKLEIPEVALREAVVNAVCHRDYLEKGANIMLEIFDDRVEISSPGGIPKGMMESDLGSRSLTRNPIIADILLRARYIEKMGTGINRMRLAMQENSLPLPVFMSTGFFTVVFFKAGTETVLDVDGVISNQKNHQKDHQKNHQKTEQLRGKILRLLLEHPAYSREDIAHSLGNITANGVGYHILHLKKQGLITRIGPDKGGYWQVNHTDMP